MSTSTAISSIEFIPLPTAAPQIRRRAGESKAAHKSQTLESNASESQPLVPEYVETTQSVEAASTGPELIAATANQADDASAIDGAVLDDFVTFDLGRKYLARIVAVNRKKVTIRRYDKKSREWRIKTDNLNHGGFIPLTPAEAEQSFPGSVVAWVKAATVPPNESGDKVMRQMSPNLAAPMVTAPVFPSVADFVVAYTGEKRTIDHLTDNFVDKVGEARQAQDDIIPHLAFMQSLLSKKGANHDLVIASRKQGDKIPWWTDFYKGYKDRLWESLRTMERRIAAYRSDPTVPISIPERDTDSVPRLNKADRRALIEGNHLANELAAAIEAGHDGKTEVARYKAVMDPKRLDDIVQAHLAEPEKPDEQKWVWLKAGSRVILDGQGFILHSAEVSEEKDRDTTHTLSARLYSLGGVIHTRGEGGFPVCRGNGSRLFGESGKDYLYAENGEAPSCEVCAKAAKKAVAAD